MIYLDDINFNEIIIHKIGNKYENEGIQFSKTPFHIKDDITDLLIHYFFTPFKHREFYHFTHSDDIKFNEIYNYALNIFEDPTSIFNYSQKIAKLLYEASNNANIKKGELYLVYFKDCIIEGEMVDAIGIFKSENKDTYLKIYADSGSFGLEPDFGININKLDKGCLIFNTLKESGYLVLAIDNLNKNKEAMYWMNEFLNIKRKKDEYYKTEVAMKISKSFIEEIIPENPEITKSDQAEYLRNSVNYFKDNENFNSYKFENEVFKSPELIESFREFTTAYEKDSGDKIGSNFEIANDAVKRKMKDMKSTIQLDKNFKISILNNSELIKKGYDRMLKMHYYTLYYKEER